jgi:hypothetical protein
LALVRQRAILPARAMQRLRLLMPLCQLSFGFDALRATRLA